VPEARRLLRDLTRGHLLTEHSPGRYAFHDLLRAYAAEQAELADPCDLRDAAARRMLDHYLHTAHAAALLLNPSREPILLSPAGAGVTPRQLESHQQALAWFEAEHHVLLAAITLAAGSGFDVHAWQLPWALTTYLDGHGHWQEQAAVQHGALEAALRLGDQAGQAAVRRLIAHNCARLGDYDQAHEHLTKCVDLYRQLEDRAGEDQQSRYAEALVHDERALVLLEAIGQRSGMALALNSAGWHHALLGDYQLALERCGQALALDRELGNRHGEAATWDSLGYAHHHLGQHAEAISCHGHAVELLAELGDRVSQASALTHLGDAQHAAGQHDAARETWQQALTILDDLRHPDASQVRGKLRQLDPAPPADVQVIALAAPGRD
jgi:tetratricopeptide (TPR) repeat protein